ncbi:putative regulatory protein SWI5 [Rosellinia necatrix]|uniref:Putative regulatory protein SWI5 n=1 Tax=Rosellinia necatrix TaxID=77044 RepID=A0A1W2TQW2_ROSNE|nr:putative regulatory protein SWI5 [Rosellinia necatrix]
MLSNPPASGLHARNRQHRRQNSTPTAYETVKIAPNLPNIQPSPLHPQQNQQRVGVLHRRGMSLDTRRQVLAQKRQEYNMVSNTNNTGSANTPQHVVREAQQQRIARPGPQQAYANLATDENYLVSPSTTPQQQSFEEGWSDGLPAPTDMSMTFDMYNAPMNVMLKKNRDDFFNTLNSSQLEMFPSSALSTPTMLQFPDGLIGAQGWISENGTANSRRNSRRISNGIMDRVNKFETMSNEPLQQPLTPPTQNETDYFPPTPIETPQGRPLKHMPQPQRFTEGYDESNEETVKPIRQRTNRHSQTIFDDMRQATEALTIMPEVMRSNSMPTTGTMDMASTSTSEYLSMSQTHTAGLAIDVGDDPFQGPSYPVSVSSEYSRHMSPGTSSMTEFEAFDFGKSQLDAEMAAAEALSDTTPQKHSSHPSQHRRTDSIASLASAASIASIDIEGTKTATGITLEDIQQYIQGPDPKDNKWICVFEDCNKKFGRKENIKSHVQTHLNDRQFKCPACHKCFVRQHDLKRHAKIHTGIKPYPCLCGNSFARHDALTRHRQRGMCIGAFEGSAPKNAKRGRPRKPRPDNDERREKATRTRRKNKSTSSASSQGTSSDASAATSPEDYNDFDMLDDIMDVSLGGTTMNPSSLQTLGSSSAPMPSLSLDDPLSRQSPSAASVQSYASQLSQVALHSAPTTTETLPPHPGSPAQSIASAINDPPELSHVSSPPGNQYFDTEPGSSGLDLMIAPCPDTSSSAPGLMPMGPGENGHGNMLECESQMLMFDAEAKFDDSYDGVDMFTTNDDLIFGGP